MRGRFFREKIPEAKKSICSFADAFLRALEDSNSRPFGP